MPCDREIAECELRIEGACLLGKRVELGNARSGQFPRHRGYFGGRRNGDLAIAGARGPFPQRPLESISPAGASGQAQALRFQKVREPDEVYILVFDVPCRARGRRLAERRHAVVEARAAAIELARRVGDFEAIRQPQDRAAKIRKAPGVDASQRADKGPLQLAPAFKEVEGAGEVADTRGVELLSVEENVLLPRKVDAGTQLVGLFRPLAKIDVADRSRSRAVAQ